MQFWYYCLRFSLEKDLELSLKMWLVFQILFLQHFKDLIRLRRTAEWPRSTLDTEVSTAKETPEIEPLPFTLAHERCISVVQKLALFLLSMDFTCHADLLLFVCKVNRLRNITL